MAQAQRASIGFEGGQVLAVRVGAEDLVDLQRRLAAGGDGWHELRAEDGPVLLHLARVVYVRADADEHRVGFALG